MLMAMANDLLVIFIALEILSLAVYILTAIRRESKEGAEAAFKYFLLGGFASAFFSTASRSRSAWPARRGWIRSWS